MKDATTEARWVGVKEGSGPWVEMAREILSEVAAGYLRTITYAELAEQVQVRTGLRTRAPYRSWIGPVLAGVVARCRKEGLPPLTSLVSHRPDGGADLDESTVLARLACYRRFADDVPPDAIAYAEAAERAEAAAAAEAARPRPARKPRTTAPRESTRKAAQEEPPKICPTCFVQLPASGICDECG